MAQVAMCGNRRVARDEPEKIARRYYVVRGSDGREQQARIERVVSALLEANEHWDERAEVSLPEVIGVPFLVATVDGHDALQRLVRDLLPRVEADPLLLALSFVDPLRVGSDELGVAWTPEAAESIRARLRGVVSFDPERYDRVRARGGGLVGVNSIRWNVSDRGA